MEAVVETLAVKTSEISEYLKEQNRKQALELLLKIQSSYESSRVIRTEIKKEIR